VTFYISALEILLLTYLLTNMATVGVKGLRRQLRMPQQYSRPRVYRDEFRTEAAAVAVAVEMVTRVLIRWSWNRFVFEHNCPYSTPVYMYKPTTPKTCTVYRSSRQDEFCHTLPRSIYCYCGCR